MKWIAYVALSGLLALNGFVFADVSMSTRYTDTGVTIFGGAFRTPEGASGVVGLGFPSGQSGEKSSPIVFFCGPPGETLLFEGETMIDLKKRVVAHFSDCFEEMEDGQVMMVAPSGALYARKNLATCRCTPEQIDAYLLKQACQNHTRFLISDVIEKACTGL